LRFFIDISYFGKNFHGWQVQENARTIQQEIDNALSLILDCKIRTLGSGRTDTGVHALSQVAHFDYGQDIDDSFLFKVNSFLTDDISINSIRKVRDNVSARFDAIKREYIYRIHSEKSPFLKDRSYFYFKEIDTNLINDACKVLMSFKDFKTFSKVKTDVNNFDCEIDQAHMKNENGSYIFIISSNRFLRGMVRAIMGTLFQINEGKLSIKDLNDIILKRDRKYAGPSVPAHGLYLNKVCYDKKIYQ
tara:strand:- start:2579 stop:3319 length:741 start_codon:yes stop_codon:yes gene_type:complete